MNTERWIIVWGNPVNSDYSCYKSYSKEFWPNARLVKVKQ